ncbi:hypothetical protein Bca52824_055960 [Brassica carinata]|uniref:Uncharacterized protein n=1 Tax=Brassica carinata TaxID=52824 RepID=A0A8X7RCS7_BRACI|nr:hypothetical protein Bca52824_055960 [Brassica carinata]
MDGAETRDFVWSGAELSSFCCTSQPQLGACDTKQLNDRCEKLCIRGCSQNKGGGCQAVPSGSLKVELLSLKGEIIARSSQPCMLRFRSEPIRLARTFVMSVPLVAGIANEAQTMRIDALMHQEKWPRTRAVRTTLIPRAQTRLLPQLYEAEIVINSKPPWTKRTAYNWKWTLCVWTSMYLYVPILIALLWCFRPFLFPYIASRTVVESQNSETEVVEEEVGGRRSRGRRNKPRRRTFTTTQETYI